jgi:tetratricopeptide (TPR) repeat protein
MKLATARSGAEFSVRKIGKFATVALLLAALPACDSAEERKVGFFQEGEKLLAAGDVDAAVAAFGNALRIDDAYVDAHAGVAEALAVQNRPGPAAAHLTKVIELAPDRLEARLDLAELLIGLGDAENARIHAEAALAQAPENPRALALRSAADLAGGDLARAVGAAREALARDPKQGIAWLTLIAERMRVEDFPGALEQIAAAEAAVGEESTLNLIRATVLERLGDRAALGAELQKLVAKAPGNDALELALAQWHMQGDPPDIDAAEALLRAIADRNPDAVEAVLGLVDFLNRVRGVEAGRAELARRAAAQGSGEVLDLALADFDAEIGERAAAIARLEAAIASKADTDDGDRARTMLARILDPVTEAARRAELVAAILARDPQNVEALTLRAEASIREDRYPAAIEDLHAALAGAPQNADILELLAVALERNGSPDLARERRAFAAQASDYAPEPTLRFVRVLLAEDNAATAEGLVRDALARAPEDRRLLAALADIRLRLGDAAGAEEIAAQIEALGDDGGLGERVRANALISAGKADEGAARLEAAWAATGAAADMETLVRAYLRAGETGKAEAVLAGAIAANPANLRARLLLVDLRLAAGDRDGALAHVEAGIVAMPESGALRVALYRLREGAGDRAGAEAALDAGLAIDPDNLALRFAHARRLERSGDFEGAIAAYEEIYARAPGDMLVANNLASLLAEHRDDPESLSRAAAVSRRLRASNEPAFLDTYGWALHRTGAHDEAVAVLRESTAALPEEPLAQFHLGMALEAAGAATEARTHLERALALSQAKGGLPPRSVEAARAVLDRIAAAAGQ